MISVCRKGKHRLERDFHPALAGVKVPEASHYHRWDLSPTKQNSVLKKSSTVFTTTKGPR